MTTAVNDVKIIMRSFQKLCDAYLKNPIDIAELLSQMRSFELVR